MQKHAYAMGKSSEILRSDLRTIHSALGEVLSHTQPDVPSWCFPEKLSAAVTLDDVFANCEPEGEGSGGRVILLEGIVDRLLLLLQSSLKLWNEAEDRPSHPLPLSLSSAVKKYCRKLLHRAKNAQDLQQQLAAKDTVVSSLSSSLSRAQEECQLLQHALRDSHPAPQARPSSILLPRCVPYEARSSLKINRLQSSQSCRQPSYNNEQSQPLAASTSYPCLSHSTDPHFNIVSSAAHSLTTGVKTQPKCTTVSTQTAETAFALCVRCSSTQNVLVLAAGRLTELCCSLQLPSVMVETDWKSEAEMGALEPGRWGKMMASDLATIKSHSLGQGKELEALKDQLAQQESLLQSEISQLSSQCELLQGSITESKLNYARKLAECHESASAQLSEIEAARKMAQEHSDKLEAQLTCTQKEKAELRASLADVGRQQCSLQAELLEVRDRETALRSSQIALQGQLGELQAELSQCRTELETDRLQLRKTSVLNLTLERKNKAILCRQSDVLQRLEELDKEAEGLRRELAETTSTRSQLASRVEELQTECSSLHAQVAEYESNSAAAAKEQQCLREELTHLELQLASLSSELEAEKQKCRLLVDYPDNCSTRALSGCESQKHISANTIRILLLEEQNSELREVMLRHARQTHGKRKTELTQPVPLWQSAVVSQAQSALDKVAPAFNSSPTPAHRTHSLSAGHLAPAIAGTHMDGAGKAGRASGSPPTSGASSAANSPGTSCSSLCGHVHMCTCADCDRMFTDRSGLHKHQVTAHLSS